MNNSYIQFKNTIMQIRNTLSIYVQSKWTKTGTLTRCRYTWSSVLAPPLYRRAYTIDKQIHRTFLPTYSLLSNSSQMLSHQTYVIYPKYSTSTTYKLAYSLSAATASLA